MKKMNKFVKGTMILTAAIMAVTTTGMTVSTAVGAEEITTSTYLAASNSKSISLKSQKAKPGETVSVPLTMGTNNCCTAYDILIEYDSRLEFESVEGAKASDSFENEGKKYVSVVGYDEKGFKDGEAAAKINFKVLKDAENGKYPVRFSQITSFSDNYADFENYAVNNAYITVTGGAPEQKRRGMELVNVMGLAGKSAVVQVVPNTDGQCSSYDILLEYDPRLILEDRDVAGANSFCIFEENGKCYVSLVGYTTKTFEDGQPMAALNFHIPQDADVNDTYSVKFVQITSFSTLYSDLEDYQTLDGEISIVKSSRPNDKYQEYKMFQKFAADGTLIFSGVGFRGDANSDGKADVRDAAAIAKRCATGKNVMDELGEFFGDVDENNKLNIRDAAKLARYIANGQVSWDAILK